MLNTANSCMLTDITFIFVYNFKFAIHGNAHSRHTNWAIWNVLWECETKKHEPDVATYH